MGKRIGLIGASGMVGREMMRVLLEHGYGDIGRVNSIDTASECPRRTGTRTAVADINRSGISNILRVSLATFISSFVYPFS